MPPHASPFQPCPSDRSRRPSPPPLTPHRPRPDYPTHPGTPLPDAFPTTHWLPDPVPPRRPYPSPLGSPPPSTRPFPLRLPVPRHPVRQPARVAPDKATHPGTSQARLPSPSQPPAAQSCPARPRQANTSHAYPYRHPSPTLAHHAPDSGHPRRSEPTLSHAARSIPSRFRLPRPSRLSPSLPVPDSPVLPASFQPDSARPIPTGRTRSTQTTPRPTTQPGRRSTSLADPPGLALRSPPQPATSRLPTAARPLAPPSPTHRTGTSQAASDYPPQRVPCPVDSCRSRLTHPAQASAARTHPRPPAPD